MTEPALQSQRSFAPGSRVGLKSLLLVGLKKQPVESLVPSLRRRAVEVASTATGSIALASCRQRRYDLIVARDPISDLSLEDLLTGIRAPGSASEHSFVQVVTSPPRIEDLRGLTGRQTGVCSTTDFGGLIGTISRVVLGIAPRVARRMMVELTLRMEGGQLSRFCQVENVSESGMLIRTADLVPVGESVGVALSVPGSGHALSMGGRVVRHTGPHEVTGFALELTEFRGSAKRLWSDYVKQERTRDDTRPARVS